jgi:carboxymethylenebutenolidase
MTNTISLTASDGAVFDAVTSGEPSNAKGCVIILQEIFGINPHIRSLPARYAAAGYFAIAPALFDRAERGVELEYNADGKARGMALKNAVDANSLTDIAATIAYAASQLPAGTPIGIVGFCWGGSLAWRSAVELDGITAAVSYYGGELPARKDAHARIPVLAHFGERDAGIPLDGVNEFIAAQSNADPAVTTYLYDADHGFNCDVRAQFDADAAAAAHDRTLAFLAEYLG